MTINYDICNIRWMIRQDLKSVLEIENSCFEFPWSEDDFIRGLRQQNCIGMVADCNDEIAGFMIYELNKHSFHLLNFAVNPNYKRKKIGSKMIEKLIVKLSAERRNKIRLEVCETNLAAQLFFKSLGFRAISVLRNFYDDKDTLEDAYSMQYKYQSNTSN